MTPLIDVIFLLLLFFMLSSTFTRFAEIDLVASGSGQQQAEARPVFVQLAPETLRLNGRALEPGDLAGALEPEAGQVLVAMQGAVTAQRLADLLAALRGHPVTVLGAP
ncbi:biopolymer transporter ExbD [Rhodovulum strictum]|uniref:Biopolymer transporter ExbD n=1 Tax=Rhodovulum strictum TaxID=58314 RepID=A0A844BDL9_9RHOB|nr:biopolymer transporter ExbD [Rhodovulum strictum]